jgi:hypothetical protein
MNTKKEDPIKLREDEVELIEKILDREDRRQRRRDRQVIQTQELWDLIVDSKREKR